MNITYTWKITQLSKAPSLDGLSDVITHVRFDYTGTDADSGESHTFQGACPLPAPDAENFSALATLTEEQVLAWVQSVHGTHHMEEVIKKAISDKVTPKNVEVTELDWLPVSAPAAPIVSEPAPAQDEAPATEETV